MHPGIQLDAFEQWLPRRAALQAGLWIWVAGFAVAGATAWRMHHQTAGTAQTNGIAADIAATPIDVAADTAEPEGAVFMPVDVVVGLRRPRIGATLSQKP
jgi:hypothetical protein